MSEEIKKTIRHDEHKVYMRHEGIVLQNKDKKEIGTRVMEDTFERKFIEEYIENLTSEIKQVEGMIEGDEQKIEELTKKFNPREQNKIKDWLSIAGKANAYQELQKTRDQLKQKKEALERNKKDLEELKAIE